MMGVIPMVEQTIEDVKKDISELVTKVIGKLNSFDSKKEREDIVSDVLNSVIAGVELSKTEKAGVLVYLLNRRTK